MSGLNWDLNELVEKVMADLRASNAVSDAARVGAALSSDFDAVRAQKNAVQAASPTISREPTNASAESASPKETSEETFDVAERVLVAETVRKLSASTTAKRWRVPSNIVATPSAKDELKKVGVELIYDAQFAAKSSDFSRCNGGKNVRRVTFSASNVFGTAEFGLGRENFESAARSTIASEFPIFWAAHLRENEGFPAFVENYLTQNFETTTFRSTCLKETTKRIAAELEKNKETRTILTTRDAAIGSIWANRFSGVRAVVAFSIEQAKRDLVAADANVVLVDPREVGPYPFRQIVEFFLRRSR